MGSVQVRQKQGYRYLSMHGVSRLLEIAAWALRFNGGGEMARSLSDAGRFVPGGECDIPEAVIALRLRVAEKAMCCRDGTQAPRKQGARIHCISKTRSEPSAGS